MPEKPLTAKQAAFCQEYIKDSNAKQAYKRAGYKDSPSAEYNACRLISKDKVKKEIGRLQVEIRRETGRTVQTLDDMYDTAFDLAQRSNQPSAMVSAVTGIARLYGMDKDNTVSTDKPEPLTKAELEALRADAATLTRNKLKCG